ncbi:T9SS type A sorting domain-containing protein [Algibacter sp. 2305UL17-15]|uniref:T9SS type A sorting domain-containing protein n=1 Tax=Algibacter sp. 2305UL17-15 TaxID=3231268 RepID=UPI00345AD5DC
MSALKNKCAPSVFSKSAKCSFQYYMVFMLFMCSYFVQAQNIDQIEYFIGNDPGIGNGTVVTATANTGELTQTLAIPLTGLPSGFHKLTLRTKDDANNWSLYSSATFYISENAGSGSDPISNIAAAEYWFDADPGLGNRSPLTISGNPSELTESFVIPLGSLDSGFHSITIRTQNLDGAWSLYQQNTFYVSESVSGSDPIVNLSGAEYWFDTDLGPGNNTALAITGNPSELTESFVIPLGSLDVGFHTIGLRTKNLDDEWSLYHKNTFYISEEISGSDPISDLAGLEYWFDTDPGPGGGTPLAISGNPSELNENLVIPLGALDDGYHVLGIRSINQDGTWSLYDRKTFYVIDNAVFETPPTSPLSEVEFLYDEELGFGTGTPLAFTPTGNTDEYLVEIPTDLVTCDIHDVWLSMKNEAGNYSLYKVLDDVDVFDNLPPTIVTFPNITAELDASGQASITIADVDNGTFDDCELVSVVLNQTQFDYTCANLGANTVTITATDAEAKVSTEDVTITVVDNINPVAITQNITVQLDGNGDVTITPAQIENGSTDNCAVTGFSLDVSSFTCANLGDNTVNLTVSDASGNTNTASATVTVGDTTNPVAITKGFTAQLDATGNVTITADDVDNSSTDNCAITSKSLDVSSFTCADIGANTVMLTVEDASGNSNTAAATVTVEDSINPVAVTQNITVQLDGNGDVTITPAQIENGSTDNCAVTGFSLDVSSFTCVNLGANTVNLTVSDASGNANTASATVTVEDTTNPVAITKGFTAQLDATGNVTITADDVDNSSTDNCAITTKSLDVSSFTCADIGANTVMLTVEDASGNSNTAAATVTVEDSVNPVVVTQNITVQLDASGSATITAAQIENGSTDNCSIASSSLDITSFTCANLGSNVVTLSVTDTSGNTGTNTATVTVEDTINPVAIGQDINRDLGGNPSVTIVASDVDNGSSDNCSATTLSIDVDTFTTPGDYPVVLTVTDGSGNSHSITVTVTIIDTLSIDDNEISAKDIKLFPIPTNDYINISTPLVLDALTIYDINGKQVYKIEKPKNRINLQNISNGVYFLRFNVNNIYVTKRIVKQ